MPVMWSWTRRALIWKPYERFLNEKITRKYTTLPINLGLSGTSYKHIIWVGT
jgi:hypothetical protein